ncbi:MAG: TetR/AcrR family transcriptional regulator [Myxococcales bacterium]|nr:TetR/AcrR family transcriptional regulator [Myxococcales bacterium]
MNHPDSVPDSDPSAESIPQSNAHSIQPGSQRRRRLGARREAAKAETREALISAAMAAFSEEGLDNPSLDAICARAGYTRGAFYVHFKDREELIQAVSERFLGRLLEGVRHYDESPAAMFNLVGRLMDAATAQDNVPLQQFLHAAGRSEVLQERYLGALRTASEHICDATQLSQARASMRGDVDPGQLAWLLLALTTGVQALREVGAPIDSRRMGDLLSYLLQRA